MPEPDQKMTPRRAVAVGLLAIGVGVILVVATSVVFAFAIIGVALLTGRMQP